MPPKLEFVREWLHLAQVDLDSARHLLKAAPPLVRPACFHAQQAIEKALKAVLVLNEQRPPRTHNLADLVGLCERWVPGLSEMESRCDWLTAFAVEVRYPDTGFEPTVEQANDALATAEQILEIVVDSSPPEVRPS